MLRVTGWAEQRGNITNNEQGFMQNRNGTKLNQKERTSDGFLLQHRSVFRG